MNSAQAWWLSWGAVLALWLSGAAIARAELMAGQGANGWSYSFTGEVDGIYHKIEFRDTSGGVYSYPVRVPAQGAKIALSPSKLRIAFFDANTSKILIFGFDELLPHFLSQNEPTDYLQEIWWERGKRQEVLYPLALQWFDDAILLLQVEGKPGVREEQLLEYDVSNWQILAGADWIEDSVFENGYGRVTDILENEDLVIEQFTQSGILNTR